MTASSFHLIGWLWARLGPAEALPLSTSLSCPQYVCVLLVPTWSYSRVYVLQVFEVFGPVFSPLYILRFNSLDHIRSKGLMEGQTVYYTPDIKEYTNYILTQQLKV